LCFVSVNGPREPYLLDEPRTSRQEFARLASCLVFRGRHFEVGGALDYWLSDSK
jgi:hypothetical protein